MYYHGKAGPDHSENAGAEAARRAFADAGVEEDAPGEPEGARQVQRVLLRVLGLGQLEASERAESVEQVEDDGDHVHGQKNHDPEALFERLEKRAETRIGAALKAQRRQ